MEAFKYTVGLQRELTEAQNKNAINDWVDKEFTSKGAIVDIAIHRVEATDSTPKNPLYNDHAHIMVTTRKLSADGKSFAKTKNEEIGNNWQNNIHNTKARDAQILEWRKSWEKTVNYHLETARSDARIDHRSHNDRGLEQLPEIHMGKKAHEAEKKGVQTKRGDKNAGRKLLQSQQKEEKSGLWKRVTRNFSDYKPVAQKVEKSWSKFKQRSWDYKMKAVEWLKQVRELKPTEQQEKLTREKQVDRQEIENRIRKEVADRLRSHVERTQNRGEHHGIKR